MSAILTNYLTKKVLENKNLVLKGSASQVCSFILGLAMTDYRPDGWDELKELIQETDIFNTYEPKVFYLKLATSLCVLEIYKEEVLKLAFQPDFIHSIMSRSKILLRFEETRINWRRLFLGYRIDIESILHVYQALSTFRPDLLHYLPEQDINDIITRSKPPSIYPLKGALETALGGEKYVKTGLRTRIGHYIGIAPYSFIMHSLTLIVFFRSCLVIQNKRNTYSFFH